jgi:N-methylhydantoinase A/oxoprolinase/acetone carboxylase beta subunit
MHYRLGIDIGGTNTDAVILDEENRVIAKGKTAVNAWHVPSLSVWAVTPN